MTTQHAISRRRFLGRSIVAGAGLAATAWNANTTFAAEPTAGEPRIPRVPGKFLVRLRSRKKRPDGSFEMVVEGAEWEVSETAIIVCDMWNSHQCDLAFHRVNLLADKINLMVSAARDHGASIIHCPGGGGVNHYEETSFRKIVKQSVYAKPPAEIRKWNDLDAKREPKLPIVCSFPAHAGVMGCDDPIVPNRNPNIDFHQHPKIVMVGYDAVTEDGQELYNFLQQERRKNIVITGVQTNICILGQAYGIRQLKYLGKNVAICRDLTDALYDPRDPPHVSHTRGTELVVDHIEKFWCPSIVSDDLTRVIPGSNDPVKPIN